MVKHISLGLAVVCMIIPLTLRGTAMSQEGPKLVDTGIIFSVEQTKRAVEMFPVIEIRAPFWVPSPEEVVLVESKLKPYLEGVKIPEAREIVSRLERYKRQYLGYTDGNDKWILINALCEAIWKWDDSWRNTFAFAFDGGSCFFNVRYELSGSQFQKLEINGGG